MNCAFCLDRLFDDSGRKLKVTKCGHVFHIDCVIDAIRHKTSECPLCKTKLLERHIGPLHLQADDLNRAPNNDQENVGQQVEPIDGIKSNNEDGANSQKDGENAEPIESSELNGEDERKVDEKLDGQNIPQTGSNSHANESAASVDDENDASVELVHRNHARNQFDGNARVVFTVRSHSANFGIGPSDQSKTNSKIDAIHQVAQNESNMFALEANKNDAGNSSGGKTVDPQNESAARKGDANKENIASNEQNSVRLRFGTQNTHDANVASVSKTAAPIRSRRTTLYDRNVRIARSRVEKTTQVVDTCKEWPKRTRVPVKHYNVGTVVCWVCGKSFRQDIEIELYDGPVVCSTECLKKE